MKAKIATTTPIKQEWLDEIKEHIPDIEFEIVPTKVRLQTYLNPRTKTIFGVFQHLRDIVNAPKNQGYRYRVYVMTDRERKAAGITDHYAAYDTVDRDGVLDFYMSIGDKDPASVSANGFKYNFARRFIHECLHGKEQEFGREYKSLTRPDRTHDWEAQGRLKELIAEHFRIKQGFLSVIAGLTKVVEILTDRLKKKPTRPTELTPLVARKAEAIISAMAKMGHAVRLVEGYRSFERQTELYDQGRTTSGAIVTNAKAGESFHNYGVAVDFVFRKEGYNATIELWELLGVVGKSQGFEWGGDWKGFTDRPHFQLTLGYSLKDFQVDKVDYSKFN